MPHPSTKPTDTAALIVAAGRGNRFGDALPKQYHLLLGKPVLAWTLNRFVSHRQIDRAVLVVASDYLEQALDLVAGKPVCVVAGADSRQASVSLGLEYLADNPPALVLVHDGVRPNPAPEVIDRVIDALNNADGAIAALAVVDTIKRSAENEPLETVDRSRLFQAQTPQGFHYPALLKAYRAAKSEFTDDAALAVDYGMNVTMVDGNADNLKITRAEDLHRMARLMGAGETRVGSGFDVHRFGPGDHVMLCGVAITHSQGLAGHSDADVGLHAITDALLGAVGAGDIGTHFPPSDPKWRGASSDQFIEFARDTVTQKGFAIVNIDITLICEAPKIGPHRDAIIDRLASLLQIDADKVSIKATTSEGLGFTGRREGIAAQAVVTVSGGVR